MRRLKLPLIFTLIFVLVGCGNSESSEKDLLIENIEIMAEGPLFEGSNTGQALIEAPLSDFLNEHKLTNEQLNSAKVSEIVLTTDDSTNFDLFQSITLQIVSDQTDMIKLGLINPIEKNSQSLTLKIAEEQEKLIEVLKQDNVYIIADAILTQDTDSNIKIKCKINFKISHK